ncbi:MAG: methyltransferase family protein [Candidatus Thorarchaeota archaeon]
MESNKNNQKGREIKHSHLVQASMPVIFVIIWILDSQIFSLSIILDVFIPLIARIILFAVVLSAALLLMKFSHDALFKGNKPSNALIVKGILSHVRNPLYLGIILLYISLLFLSFSIICVALLVVIVLVYNKMVNYEEKVLESIFGNPYLEYKEKTPKWIPKLSSN